MTQIDYSRTLKFTFILFFQDLNVNSPCCLQYISYFLFEFNKCPVQNFPGPVALFQDFAVLEMPQQNSRTFLVFQDLYEP